MQKAYITELYAIMREDKNVYSFLSDSGTDYDLMMARDFPAQCFNFGIAEQNKVAAASGAAQMGKIPFVYTTGAFLAYRAYEFIRDDVCFQNRNVKCMGMGTGVAWSTLGPSHHSTEDIAALRALPNLTLLSAATPLELRRLVRFAYETEGPVYLRLGMSGEEELFNEETYAFNLGKPIVVSDFGSDITVFVTGAVAAGARRAVARLHENGLAIRLYNMPTLKPIDSGAVYECAKNSRVIFTVEEHSTVGGLGGAIAEILAECGAGIPLSRIGLDNRFASGYGKTEDVRRLNGLDADGICGHISTYINNGGF